MSRLKHAKELAQRQGLTVLEVVQTKGDHIRVRASNSMGWVANFILPATPSDWRGERNKAAEFRRFARGTYSPNARQGANT